MKAVYSYETEKAIVKIRPGKLRKEERRYVLEAAARQFYKAILAAEAKCGKAGIVGGMKCDGS